MKQFNITKEVEAMSDMGFTFDEISASLCIDIEIVLDVLEPDVCV